MKIKQSVCLPMMKPQDAPLRDFCAEIARIGFPAVEIWGRNQTFDELVDVCREKKLVISSMIGHGGLDEGLLNPAYHDRIESELMTSIDVAATAHIPGIICYSGARNPAIDEQTAIANTADGLCRVSAYAEKKGVNLNLELLNSKVDHAGYQADHTWWGVEVCRRVNSPRVKLLYDIYHMQIMEGDVIRTITENIRWIGHFHTAGVPGRMDMDDTQELNYAAICDAIAATDYSMYVGHEFKPRGDAVAAMETAFSICDRGM